MSLLLALIGAVTCMMIGIRKSQSLYKRVGELEQALIMLEKLNLYLCYEQKTTADIIESLSNTTELKSLLFLPVCQKQLSERVNFPTAWRNAVLETQKEMYYTKEDASNLSMIADVLGASDSLSQQKGFEMVRGLVVQALESAQKTWSEKGQLYRSIGMLSGIGMAILLF